MQKLEGKVAVVTGGSSGIGLATAKLFAAEGAQVFITGRRQAELDAAVDAGGKGALVHGVDGHDPRIESIALGKVAFVPVMAPGFLATTRRSVRPDDPRACAQAVIRDTARHAPGKDHFMIAGAHQCTVPDQATKKEVILHGLAWDHLPRFLVEKELRSRKLVSIAGKHLPASVETLVAARRADVPHGPVAQALWECIGAQRKLR